MDPSTAAALARSWVQAWNDGDTDAVMDLLHPDATVADVWPRPAKVRAADVRSHLQGRFADHREAVVAFECHLGVDSIALVCELEGGAQRVDTLVLADDGRVVRVMLHG